MNIQIMSYSLHSTIIFKIILHIWGMLHEQIKYLPFIFVLLVWLRDLPLSNVSAWISLLGKTWKHPFVFLPSISHCYYCCYCLDLICLSIYTWAKFNLAINKICTNNRYISSDERGKNLYAKLHLIVRCVLYFKMNL